MNVIQRHEIDGNGRLIVDSEAANRDKTRQGGKRRQNARLVRQIDVNVMPVIHASSVKLKADSDIWGPIISSQVIMTSLEPVEPDLVEYKPSASNFRY